MNDRINKKAAEQSTVKCFKPSAVLGKLQNEIIIIVDVICKGEKGGGKPLLISTVMVVSINCRLQNVHV